MNFLRYSTATITTIGPFLGSGLGDTEVSFLAIAQADVRLSYNGDSWHQVHHNQNSVNLQYYEHGYYKLYLDTTDTSLGNSTYAGGNLVISIHKAGTLAVWKEYTIIPQNLFDYMFSSTQPATTVPLFDDKIEGTYTLRQYMTWMAAVLFSKATGGGTTSITFRNVGDSINRIVATVDSNGNRSSITLTG